MEKINSTRGKDEPRIHDWGRKDDDCSVRLGVIYLEKRERKYRA